MSVWKRRAILAGGALAVGAWVKGAPHLLSLRAPSLNFRNLDDVPPFRELTATGTVSTNQSIFAGLSTGDDVSAAARVLAQQVRDNPCDALFGALVPGRVPVAVFSDFRCPNCRVMDARLLEIEQDMPDRFYIVRHELPILGDGSTIASRAVLAAQRQGAYGEMYARLIRTPAVTDLAFVSQAASSIGLDVEVFQTDLQSSRITEQLLKSKAVADVFNFIGTPAFVVGRTAFLGTVTISVFKALIGVETDRPCDAADT
tara:strand:+ start:4819 stop:5592 length:774 start_codon:yes stop_codon:yes gene_type:complete